MINSIPLCNNQDSFLRKEFQLTLERVSKGTELKKRPFKNAFKNDIFAHPFSFIIVF